METCALRSLLKLVSSFVLFLISISIFAANSYYIGGSIGASRASVGDTYPSITYYHDELTDAYPIHGSQATKPIINVNVGYEFEGLGFRPAIAVGLGVYSALGDYHYNGQLIETAIGDPSSTLYHYQFQVQSTRFMAEAQFAWILGKFIPFMNIGLGPAWVRMSDFSESPVNSTGYVPLPPFQSQTNINLAYQVGLGIGYAFNFKNGISNNQHERIALVYRYANLGDASFGTRGTVYPYHLDTGRLTTNELYIAYTHLF